MGTEAMTYLIPSTIAETLHLLAEYGDRACPIAGGTDLLVARRRGRLSKDVFVDIMKVEQLSVLELSNGGQTISIGATCTHARLARELDDVIPALADACRRLGSPQVRNVATLGGNLVNASPAGDTAPALVALGAQVELVGNEGVRRLPVAALFAGPGQTALRPGEILARVIVDRPRAGEGMAFLKLGRRRSLAISVASAAAVVRLENRIIADVRLALGAVAPKVALSKAAELLKGNALTDELLGKVALAVEKEVCPIGDIRASSHYRRVVAGVLARRAIAEAYRRAAIGASC